MDWLDLLQWPAFAVTVVAAWLVASETTRRRLWGFLLFLVSNALWIAWGWHDAAWALYLLAGGKVGGARRRIAGNGELRAWVAEASGTPDLTNVRGVVDNRDREA